MSDNKKEQNIFFNKEINSIPINEELKLVGNKREREKDVLEEEKKSKIICNCCKLPYSEQNIFSKKLDNSQTIINNLFKENEFMKTLKECIDKEILGNNNKINKFCNKCLLNEFIKGGINKIFSIKKSDEGEKKQKTEQEMPTLLNNKIKSLIGIYSINLNLAIQNLRSLKDEYSEMIKKVKKIFENTCMKILLSNGKDPFQEPKKKIDDCEDNMKEIGAHFDNLIDNLTNKEEMKTFILDCVKNDEPEQKNTILKILKRLENETMNSIFESNINNIENKNIKSEKDKNNIAENLIQNNNDLLKNNLLLSQNNLLNNAHNLFNPGLGILPIGIPANPSNNPLLNSLMLNPILNPSIPNPANNTINLNSMNSNLNNNTNEGNKNLNNLNNLQFPGLNNLPGQNSSLNSANNLEAILMIRSLLNNSIPSNNMMNNLYSNQINPNLISPIGFNNFFHPPSQWIHPNINNSNNNNFITLNNNSSLDEKNLVNKKNPMNLEKNVMNIYPNNNNNISNNNVSNTKEINNLINNINNSNEPLQNNINIQNQPENGCLTQLFNNVAAVKEKTANSKNNNHSNNKTQK